DSLRQSVPQRLHCLIHWSVILPLFASHKTKMVLLSVMQYTDRYCSYKSPYDLSLVSGRMSIMSSTVQFNFLQILTSISIDTNSFLESFARVLVLMPTSFANSVLFSSLSMSSLKSLL